MYINEASKKSGTTKKAIEYYCQKGLLDPAVSDKGYRIFSDEDVEKLKKISLLRFPGNISNKQILLMFVKQIFEDFENLENKKESNLNKTCCCRPFKNGYNESGRIYLYNSIARA